MRRCLLLVLALAAASPAVSQLSRLSYLDSQQRFQEAYDGIAGNLIGNNQKNYAYAAIIYALYQLAEQTYSSVIFDWENVYHQMYHGVVEVALQTTERVPSGVADELFHIFYYYDHAVDELKYLLKEPRVKHYCQNTDASRCDNYVDRLIQNSPNTEVLIHQAQLLQSMGESAVLFLSKANEFENYNTIASAASYLQGHRDGLEDLVRSCATTRMVETGRHF